MARRRTHYSAQDGLRWGHVRGVDTDRTRNARRTSSILHDPLAVHPCHHDRRQTSSLVVHPRRSGWTAWVCDQSTPGRAHVECTCVGGGSIPSERLGVEREPRVDRRDWHRIFDTKTEQVCGAHRDPERGWISTPRTVCRKRSNWVRAQGPPPRSKFILTLPVIGIVQSTSTYEISRQPRTHIPASYTDVSTYHPMSDCLMTSYRLSMAQIRFSWGRTMTLGRMVNGFRRT